MSFLGGLSNLGAVEGGFQAQQQREQQLRAAQMRNQEQADAQMTLRAIGEAYGMVPPGPQQAAPPGVASQPAPQAPAQQGPVNGASSPASPPNTMLPSQPLMAQQQRGPIPQVAAAPQVSPPQALPQVSPQVAAAPAAPSGQQQKPQQFGMLTLDQVRDKLMSTPRNQALFAKRPDLLFKAMTALQQAMAPEARAELAQAKQAMEYDTKIREINRKADADVQRAQTAQQVAEIRAEASKQVADIVSATRLQTTGMQQQGAGERVAAQQQGAGERVAAQQQGATARAGMMNLGKLTAMATKAGVQIADGMSAEDIQKATAAKLAQTATDKKMDSDTVQFMAESIRMDPSLISRIGRNDANRKAILDALAKLPGIDPGTLASAKVALGEKVAAGQKIGGIEGATRQALEEMAPFSKLVRASAGKVDNSKYPTINSIVQAAQRGTGDPNVISLGNNIQALKNAFTQAMQRGGATSVHAQERADELINMTMSPKQLDAAIKSMEAEVQGISGAAQRATKGIAAEAGGKTAAPTGQAAPSEDDPLGILK